MYMSEYEDDSDQKLNVMLVWSYFCCRCIRINALICNRLWLASFYASESVSTPLMGELLRFIAVWTHVITVKTLQISFIVVVDNRGHYINNFVFTVTASIFFIYISFILWLFYFFVYVLGTCSITINALIVYINTPKQMYHWRRTLLPLWINAIFHLHFGICIDNTCVQFVFVLFFVK